MLRFAPSPTGDLDINGLRVALLNYIVSKQTNQELLIRIDDIEKEKVIEKKDKEILALLDLFNIEYSRVIIQSENIKYHTGMGMKLLLDKSAFNCFCTQEALEEDRKKAEKENIPYSYSGFCETISDETKFHCNAPFVVRLKKPEENINFSDFIQGECEYQPYETDSVVILDHSKTPTPNFAGAVDDMLYDISTIIRGKDQLINTPKQIHIRKALGYDKELEYAHIPNILSEEIITVQSLVDQGYLPAAIANYLVTLGVMAPKEIFTIEEAFEWFDIQSLVNQEIEFDIEKLNKINTEHLKTLEDMRLSKIIGYADEDIGKLAKLYLDECNTTEEIKVKIDAIFSKKEPSKLPKGEFKTLTECLSNAPFIKDYDELQNYITDKTGLEDETLLRVALTGAESGPKLKEIYPLIKNYLGEIVC